MTPARAQTVDASDASAEIDLAAVLVALRKWWLLILFCGLIMAALGFAIAKNTRPVYAATLGLQLLKNTDSTILDPLAALTGGGPDEAYLNSEILGLQSSRLAGIVVDKLDLIADPDFNPSLRPPKTGVAATIKNGLRSVVGFARSLLKSSAADDDEERERVVRSPRETAAEILRKAISVTRLGRSQVLEITVTAYDPGKAVALANAYAEAYVETRTELKYTVTTQALEFLQERVPKLEEELEEKDDKVTQFRSVNGIASDEVLATVNDRLVELLTARDRSIADHDRAERVLAQWPTPPADQTEARALLETLGLRSDSGESQVVRAAQVHRAQIALIADYEADKKNLDDLIAVQRSRIEREASKLLELRQLERESTAAATIYETFLTSLKEVAQQAAVREDDARVISDPRPPSSPIKPRTGMIVGISLILGLAIGGAIAVVRTLLFSPFETKSDLSGAFDAPVVGATLTMPRGVDPLSPHGAGAPEFLKAQNAIINARSMLALANGGRPPKVVTLTSTQPAEGKTTTSVMMARAAASAGKVLLIDGDMRRRTLSEHFGFQGRKGLIHVLVGDEPLDGVVQTLKDFQNIDFLPAGRSQRNPADALMFGRLKEMIDQTRTEYSAVFIDAPPTTVATDAAIMARVSDIAVYAVRLRKTRRPAAMRAFANFAKQTGGIVTVLGTFARKKDGYGYEYEYDEYD